ncbi:hypothetical protein ANTRET_LOCUS3086 [Anthophora retusa]
MEEQEVKKRGYYSEIVTGTTEDFTEPELQLSTAPRRSKLAWQVSTEHHSAHVRQLHDEQTYNFLGEAKRWISFAEDRSIVSSIG